MTPEQWSILKKTVSPNAFYYMCLDSLRERYPLSAVRMADGEHALLKQVRAAKDLNEVIEPPPGLDEKWLTWLGVNGISKGALSYRLNKAATDCSHFCPSINGIAMENYNVYQFFPERDFYVDNFFPDQITVEQKTNLYKAAGHVLFIHGNAHTADSMQLRVQANLDVKVSYIKLTHWSEAQGVTELAAANSAPLVLFAGGPASKWIGPEIARKRKVVLDLGHAADVWTMTHLPVDREKANAFHKKWSAAH